jgi:hypothetical protein
MKTYIVYTMIVITFFYITIGEKDRMGTRAFLRDGEVVSGAYLPR